MCQNLLRDARFYRTLLRCDEDMAGDARVAGCACGGVLHSARYPRKPRGGLVELGADYCWRLSFCCSEAGCRRRTTPPSVRFLGRRVYLAAVVVLMCALRDGVTPRRASRLRELVGVSVRTLERWRAWWLEEFPASGFWRHARARFSPPVDVAAFPSSLLDRFPGAELRERLVSLLSFLSPITTRGLPGARNSMGFRGPQGMRLDARPATP